jgi:hypothetical protein
VEASYNAATVDQQDLTVTAFPVYYEGREIVVAGRTLVSANDLDIGSMSAEVSGVGAEGSVDYVVPTRNLQRVQKSPSIEDSLAEKLWAYMKVKAMLAEMQAADNATEKSEVRAKALNMSLTYGFVTPLTSFNILAARQEDLYGAGDYVNYASSSWAQQADTCLTFLLLLCVWVALVI